LFLPSCVEFIIVIQVLNVNLKFDNFIKRAKMPKADHGGKRVGAGRKPIDPDSHSVTIALSVPESLLERLDALAAKHGWNRAEAVREAIRGLVSRK
jgi:hypothetical protein